MDDQVIGGRYRVLDRLENGDVLARDTTTRREVTIRAFPASPGQDPAELERGLREARSATSPHEDHVVAVQEVLGTPDENLVVMEHVPGPTLAAVLRSHGPMPPRRVAELGAQVAGAMSPAHQVGVLHRDLRPATLLLAPGGIAMMRDLGLPGTGRLTSGTDPSGVAAPEYLAPECAGGGRPSAAADVWALGVTLYELVEGHLPVPMGSSAGETLRHVLESEPAQPLRSGGLTPVLGAMLDRNPRTRLTMAEAAADLREVAAGRPAALSLAGPVPARHIDPGPAPAPQECRAPAAAPEPEREPSPWYASTPAADDEWPEEEWDEDATRVLTSAERRGEPSAPPGRPDAGASSRRATEARPAPRRASGSRAVTTPPPEPRRRRRPLAALVLALLVVSAAGAGGYLYLNRPGDPGDAASASTSVGTASPGPTGSAGTTATALPHPTAPAASTTSGDAAGGAPAPGSSTTAGAGGGSGRGDGGAGQTPSASTAVPSNQFVTGTGAPEPAVVPGDGTLTSSELSAFPAQYLALATKDPEQAWARTSPAYQAAQPGGKAGYVSYWQTKVSAATVVAAEPDERAQAVIVSYTLTDPAGTTSRARARWVLVDSPTGPALARTESLG